MPHNPDTIRPSSAAQRSIRSENVAKSSDGIDRFLARPVRAGPRNDHGSNSQFTGITSWHRPPYKACLVSCKIAGAERKKKEKAGVTRPFKIATALTGAFASRSVKAAKQGMPNSAAKTSSERTANVPINHVTTSVEPALSPYPVDEGFASVESENRRAPGGTPRSLFSNGGSPKPPAIDSWGGHVFFPRLLRRIPPERRPEWTNSGSIRANPDPKNRGPPSFIVRLGLAEFNRAPRVRALRRIRSRR